MSNPMRIVAGKFKGHGIVAPKGLHVRPTADRVREALFNILGPPDQDALVLDLFAGTGALGLEALSRGAAQAFFVDKDPAALQSLRQNIQKLGVSSSASILVSHAQGILPKLPGPFDWIFVDPPYYQGLYKPILDQLGSQLHLLKETTTVIVEHPRKLQEVKHPPEPNHGVLRRVDQRHYGQNSLSFYQPVLPLEEKST